MNQWSCCVNALDAQAAIEKTHCAPIDSLKKLWGLNQVRWMSHANKNIRLTYLYCGFRL